MSLLKLEAYWVGCNLQDCGYLKACLAGKTTYTGEESGKLQPWRVPGGSSARHCPSPAIVYCPQTLGEQPCELGSFLSRTLEVCLLSGLLSPALLPPVRNVHFGGNCCRHWDVGLGLTLDINLPVT